MVGPSAHADNVQTEFHKLIDVDVARGWDHQLKDEPGVILTYARKWRHFPLNGGPRREWSPHLAASVGNVYTYGAAGMMVRWGTNLRTDIGPPNIRLVSWGAVFPARSQVQLVPVYGIEGGQSRATSSSTATPSVIAIA